MATGNNSPNIDSSAEGAKLKQVNTLQSLSKKITEIEESSIT